MATSGAPRNARSKDSQSSDAMRGSKYHAGRAAIKR